ncbi:MAG: tetratricopeptide repeat protein [Terriglobia bacterium]
MRTIDRITSVREIGIRLQPRSRAVVFALAFVIPAILVAAKSLRLGGAATLAQSFNLSRLRLAVTLAPDSPDTHASLGSYYLYSPEDLAPRRAVEQFRRAIRLNPLQAPFWQGLAKACEASEDSKCAEHAVERAVKLSPMTPRVWWEAGVISLAGGRTETALACFRRLLALDPKYAPAVFRLCPQLDHLAP